MAEAERYRLEVRFGDDLLEAGFTAVPNLLLNNYADLGINDGAAFWIVHLLKFKWTEDNPYPRRSSIPMNANRDTQKRYARQLRNLGLLFTRRIYWSNEDNPPDPGLAGKIRALEYDLTSLFHNVVRISRWKAEGSPLDEFQVELPLEIVRKVVDGYFHHVPKKWKLYCQWQMAAIEDEMQETQDQGRPTEPKGGLEGENHTIGRDELGGENHPVDRSQLQYDFHPLENKELPVENRPLVLQGDFQPVENHPNNKENTHINKKQSPKKEEQQQNTHTPVVVPFERLKHLTLTNDQVIVDQNTEGLGLMVMSIEDVVKYELRRRRSEPSYRANVYFSVEDALGEGPDDWTEEELARIKRKSILERQLAQRYRKWGAFTLEGALQQYFTPEFTVELLTHRDSQELQRIENWVAYVRCQKNLTSPAGFLRTKIESGEAPPALSPSM